MGHGSMGHGSHLRLAEGNLPRGLPHAVTAATATAATVTTAAAAAAGTGTAAAFAVAAATNGAGAFDATACHRTAGGMPSLLWLLLML